MGFNGATTLSLWKARPIVFWSPHLPELQWGHNVIVVERSGNEEEDNPAMSSFNGATTLSLWKVHLGAIGSQSNGACFNGATTLSLWKDRLDPTYEELCTTLQWGHNVIVVESWYLLSGFGFILWLQWGHNVIVVERSYPSLPQIHYCQLQWGHNVIVVESV